MKKILFILLLATSCKDRSAEKAEGQMKYLKYQMDAIQEKAEEKMEHLKFEQTIEIELMKQGLRGKELNKKLDSVCLSDFERDGGKGYEPDWHKEQRRQRDSIELMKNN